MAHDAGHGLLRCLSITLITLCRWEGTCSDIEKLGWSRSLMPAFDLPHLGKQLPTPHISFCFLPSNFTDAKACLFPKDDTYHLSSAAEASSPGPPTPRRVSDVQCPQLRVSREAQWPSWVLSTLPEPSCSPSHPNMPPDLEMLPFSLVVPACSLMSH